MRSVVEESLLRNFEMLDPFSYSRMTSYEMPDKFSLIVTLDDGSKLLYDDMEDSTRYLNLDPTSLTDDEMLNEFRYRLRHAMRSRGYNQLMLAEDAGISEVMISRYLTGVSVPSFLNVMKIAKALKCSLDELWYT